MAPRSRSVQRECIDPYGKEGELRYAIALNQSVELQQEVTLVFLLQTAFRQLKQLNLLRTKTRVSMDMAMEREDEGAVRAIGIVFDTAGKPQQKPP